MTFKPADPFFENRVRESFTRQRVMTTLGAQFTRVSAGEVDIEMPYRSDLTQQHGYLHAGIVTTVLDSACGYAAFTLIPAGATVLSVEFKTNLLAPAAGELFFARGRVVRAGRSITVCEADGWMRDGGDKKHVALMIATIKILAGRSDYTGK
jgi:uncharacterized protein (TIGR00369 family)